MIILLLVLTFLITIIGSICISDFDDICFIIFIPLVIELIVLVVLCIDVSKLKIIDDEIAMYKEENQRIETQMDDLITNYMEYEGNTFKEFNSESAVTLINLYPDLKSNELVQKQLDVYIANNNKIKELKVRKINGKVYKWWLYFGGGKE